MGATAGVSGLGTGQLQLKLSNAAEFPEGCEFSVVLSKLKAGPLTAEDIPAGVAVATVAHSPLSGLYHTLKDVYSPLIQAQSAEGNVVLDKRLFELLVQVQAGLGTAVRKGTPASAQEVSDPNQAPLQEIATPLDEVNFWAELTNAPNAGPIKTASLQVTSALEALRQPLELLISDKPESEGGMGWEGAKELVDLTVTALRQTWPVRLPIGGWAMGQKRTDNFLRVMGAALAGYVQRRVARMGKGTSSDLWSGSFAEVRPLLVGASGLMTRWVQESDALVEDWRLGVETGGHDWEGPAFADGYIKAFQERLDEVYNMREMVDELFKLLGKEESGSLGVQQVFAPFTGMEALQVSDYTTHVWKSALEDFERRMGPIEQRISQKLKELFGSVIIPSLTSAIGPGRGGDRGAAGSSLIQPQQVFAEIKRYSGLMGRKNIANALQTEKEHLAKQVDRHIDSVQGEFDSHRDSASGGNKVAPVGRVTASIVERIMWCMQTSQKLAKVSEVLKHMLRGGVAGDEGSGGAALRNTLGVVAELTKEVEIFRKEQYAAWEDWMSEELGEMANWKNSKLMTFDSQNSHVKTHFNDQLVLLLREVRQLQSLGFGVRKDILNEVEIANKFYRYGMVLKQRANFYNNIATEMVPCQKPMMLKDALEFEKVLMNPKDAQSKEITWRNAAALEGYVRRLNEVADRLAEKNRTLRKWHTVLSEKVVNLAGTDLVRHKDKWAAGVKEMRDIFGRLEAEGYSRESQQVWRQHWDFQLYKALEVQYLSGLEMINKTLPEVEVKMVFRQHRLQYDPPLEELRIRHVKDLLNTFLGLPLRMKGVSDLSERPGFFRPIVDANPAGIARVYAAAEALFAQLAEELKKYQDWMVLGTLDLDEFTDTNLVEVSDWELNFRMLKAASRDAEKLPNEVRIECYKVSLAPIKATIDEHMKKLQEALVSSLRRKTLQEKDQVEDFMKNGRELFTKQANTVEDIGNAGQEAKSLTAKLVDVQAARRRIDEKNKLLRQMAGGGRDATFAVVDLTEVNNSWDAFTTQLQQFDAHLEEQKGALAVQIGRQLEEFKGKVTGMNSRWQELKPKSGPSGNPAVVLAKIQEYANAIKELREESAKLQKEAEAFKIDVPDFDLINELEADVMATKSHWDRYADFLRERDEMANRDWLSMRDQVWKIEDFLAKWTKAIAGKGSDDPIAVILVNEIDNYTRCLPHLKSCLRGAGWEDSHWNQLFGMLGMKTTGPAAVSKETVTLTHFLEKADLVVKHADAIKALDAQAQGEAVIRKALSELKMWGMAREFTFTESTQSVAGRQRRTPLIKEWRDAMTEVGDNQSLVASLKQSSYYNMFKDEVSSWENKLSFLQEGLTLLNQIQRKWVYLEPIFGRGALPSQQQRFRNVDEEFRRTMTSLESTKKVVTFADIPGIRDKLPQMAQQLDVCQRALADFLEEKRSQFPRFYFLGDDDLLEILGQARNPAVIQSHLKKLFAGIQKVKFSQDQSTIQAMQSMEGEVVDLAPTVRITEQIETWLGDLTRSMRNTLQQQNEVLCAGRMNDEFRAAASQNLQLKEAVAFTEKAEVALKAGASGVKKLVTEMRAQLNKLTASDFTGHHLLQLKKQALVRVLDFIHYCDVAEYLDKDKVVGTTEWGWTRQLRYYHRAEGSVKVSMAEATFDYTWEYQGNAAKLVYTPLTDKCYLTLTQGMALGYGGNPYGPAGTGKTESVKALGQALARQVLVFNCDEEFDFKSMGRIFVGLVKCGAWGCFDEFNRLDEEVLSAVSQQIQTIQLALKEGAKTMQFMEKPVEVDKNAGIFVTLNPAGKGYGGRSKLPDNLKQLFRSIAMTVPNNELIAEVLLLSEGFNFAKDLARKLVSLFSLSRELLSPQQHYDWGLRALKTVLGIAGRELRDARKQGQQVDAEVEAEIIIRSVAATKLPTLTFDDNSRFKALIADLFPGAKLTDARNEALEKALVEAAASCKMELTQQQIDRMLQLHLACEQRIGVIIVGPSGSGKSTLWEMLERAYERLGRKPIVYKMNPKAMPRQQLLGSMNMDTREWSDGVLTAAARKVVKEPLEQRSWIICDGDVDPEWIESLNSVLDDNRLLTMPNGERIQFANNVNMIFECHSLEFASPATVSRCGMLFMSDEAMEVERMITRWLKLNASGENSQNMIQWMGDFFDKAFQWALSHPKAVETTKGGILESALSHLKLGPASKVEFMAGLCRGLGSNMNADVRNQFYTDMARLSGEGGIMDVGVGGDPLALVGEELRERGMDDSDSTLVVTPEVTQNLLMLAPWLKSREPFMVVGPEGCGKGALLDYCFKRIMGVQVAVVNCSAQTSASNVVQKLVQVCGKPVTTTNGKALRPPDNTRVVLYLKDLNLPRPDKYNTCQLISFLQQLITHKGYYDENLDFIRVERVQIVGSMTPPGSVGRHALSTRFTALVRIMTMNYPDKENLNTIYTNMAQRALAASAAASSVTPAALSKAMLEVYTSVRERFTPNDHPHYEFNARDLTDWMTGLQRYSMDNGMTMVQAIYVEGLRVFRDRLVGDHQEQFTSMLEGALQSLLNYKPDSTPWYASTLGASAEERISGDLTKIKMLRWEQDTFTELVAEKLKGYEREHKELNLLLFPEVLERVARFDRVLSQPGGSLLLCGNSGVGRRSLMLLLAYMHNMEFYTPKMTKSYDLKSFRNDLKEVLRRAGVEGRPLMLFLEDHQLVSNSFLEMVNSLLSGGEVPGLFTPEELAKELAPLDKARDEDPLYTGPSNSYSFFSYRVRRNLHIVVSMDPTNDQFRARCEANPALFTRCSVQWIEAWSTKGLQQIAGARLKELVSGSKELTKLGAGKLIDHLVHFHTGSGSTTTREYLALVQLYGQIYNRKRTQVLEQQNFLKGGLGKLAEAAKTVDTLSAEAEKQRIVLKAKQAEADEALVHIQDSMMKAADRRKEVEVLKKRTAIEEVQMKERRIKVVWVGEGLRMVVLGRGQVEEELSEVQPLIDSARKAVGNIKKDNIAEIRSLKMPPDAIRDVLEGVLMILGQQDTSWNNMKTFLGKSSVKDDIINYDAHKITPEIRARVDKHLAAKGNSFEEAVIRRVSVAAAPMAQWCKANLEYSRVLTRVAPLEAELHKLQASLEESQRLIAQYESELVQLDAAVAQLKNDFSKKTSEAESLKMSVDKAEATLSAARQLLDGLRGEKVRWESTVGTLGEQLKELPLSSLLAAAFITYLPAHPEEHRLNVMKEWTTYLGVAEFDICRFLSSESEMLKWKAEGLPADGLSAQNAVVILNSTSRSPLIIDPSTQASEWLNTHLKVTGANIEVTTMADQRFTTTLELAVRFGKTLVVAEVDKVEPILYPLLRRDLDRQGPRFVVQVGDKATDYNDTFRIFLVTRNPDPYLPPDARSLLAVTNFTVTRSGLEGQLLGLTLQKERPELEEQKSTLLRQEDECKVALADLEKNLLQTLATSTGNILENKELLDKLNETKTKSATVEKALVESKSLQASLDQQREVYRPIAARGSVMYFLLADLQALNQMYTFSLNVFLNLFKKALNRDTPPGGDVTARIALLAESLLELVFAYVSRSLFNSDRLTFGMHMARHLQPSLFPESQWAFFLGKPVPDAASPPPKPSWVREEQSSAFTSLAAAFPQLVSAAELHDSGLWAQWASGATDSLPGKISGGKVNPFQQLLLVKAFRPDRLQSAMSSFICGTLNIKSVSPPPFSLKALIDSESKPEEPVLFITTPGADPSQELSEYAATTLGKDRYFEIAMGQGQAEKAVTLLRECAKSGDWLVLKNVHLAVSWLPSLEKELLMLQKHENFRLFLTSEPHPKFPSTLLEMSLKITFEAPPGIKKNLQRTYEAWSAEYLASGSPIRAQLLFVLSWFHAVVQERRTYIPQGWTKFYEFSFADLRSGMDVISQATRSGGPPQWPLLLGLLDDAIYGGRLDNPFDMQVLQTFMRRLFNSETIGAAGGKVRPLPGSKVVVPTTNHRADYVSIISALPDVDTPGLFCMPDNIDRTAQQVNSTRVISQLKAMSLRADAAGGFNRAQWQAQLGPLLRLWDQLMTGAGALKAAMKDIRSRGTGDRGGSPVENFIALERYKGASLVALIDRSLGGIARVLKGTDTLSSSVQANGAALLTDTVPGAWDAAWEGPEAPMDYCRAVVAKALAIENHWQRCTQPGGGGLLDGSGGAGPLELSSVFHPGTFLNALRQQSARSLGCSMDTLKPVTSWDAGKMRAAAGAAPVVLLGGMIMQGATFDGSRLSPVTAEAPAFRAIPPMSLAWLPKDAPMAYSTYMDAPLYMTSERTKLLARVQLPVSGQEEQDSWVLAGLSLFLSV
ncbi:DHC7 protein [Gonium pectorale]|uniref:Cytoplasmic dynein 2 heavy chain 1 n=1 Tax=Gonium pectorale TaxID=33097 RepID=A0A150G7S6_GONPE|nr:DHC7 protein [Gonium pectorale]|eukprot:KXZ45909.1 DHC7 protein [Gonium pectorale]